MLALFFLVGQVNALSIRSRQETDIDTTTDIDTNDVDTTTIDTTCKKNIFIYIKRYEEH
jgi:hypothetical protein